MRGAPGEDLLRRDRAHPGQGVELLGGRGVQVDLAGRASAGRTAAPASASASASAAHLAARTTDDQLRPVGDRCGQVEITRPGPPGQPTRRHEGVLHSCTLRQFHHPGPAHLTEHVHQQLCRRRRAGCRGRRADRYRRLGGRRHRNRTRLHQAVSAPQHPAQHDDAHDDQMLTDELTHPWRPRHQRCPATGRNGRIGFGIVAGRYSQDGPPLGLCCRRWRRDLIGVDAAPRRDLGEQCLQAPPDHLGEVIGRSISAHHVLTVGRCPEIRSNWFGLCG